ncbi:pilus assembly protein PilP [Solimonas marina]|uniref:Pilus assembly protein PilP n=1 Tax=Solimonas marina TaxID=2714601 RepID=A0A970B7G1_9GAMM|nr:pilus assembly protein PilP [Solimonas marina]NKF21159.1 pilus assembly protein PilP [Solimonas marina]
MSIRALLIFALALGVTACGSNNSDLDRYIAEVKARKSKNIEPIPQVKPYQPYSYTMAGKRDPFVLGDPNANSERNPNGPRPNLRRNREPLEEYPLDALSMMGVITTPQATYALVKAPDGVVHRVGLHEHMGQNYGEVVAIDESEIKLLELVPDGFGGWTQRSASLALSQ